MFESLRQLVTQLLALLQVRIELLTTELSGELRRLAVILVWAAVGLLFAFLALLMIITTVIVAFWDTNRLLAVGLVALLFVVLAGLAVWQVLRRVRNGPPLLEGTLAELRRDRAALDAAARRAEPGTPVGSAAQSAASRSPVRSRAPPCCWRRARHCWPMRVPQGPSPSSGEGWPASICCAECSRRSVLRAQHRVRPVNRSAGRPPTAVSDRGDGPGSTWPDATTGAARTP
ncbi:MAG: phage holin family protein [Proteobacteria bacterium]|nr:phage holin family protein [Pseudomonadota bacterium]